MVTIRNAKLFGATNYEENVKKKTNFQECTHSHVVCCTSAYLKRPAVVFWSRFRHNWTQRVPRRILVTVPPQIRPKVINFVYQKRQRYLTGIRPHVDHVSISIGVRYIVRDRPSRGVCVQCKSSKRTKRKTEQTATNRTITGLVAVWG